MSRFAYLRSLRKLGRAALTAAVLAGGPGTAIAGAQSACADLGGMVDPDQICHVRNATSSYQIDFSFPVDYPDQQALTDYLTQQRDQLVSWVAQHSGQRDWPYELTEQGTTYRSGTPALGTRSLVFAEMDDTGAHPVTDYKAFNYDLGRHAPIAFDTLFKPGTKPLEVLNPIVQREVDKHGGPGALTLGDLGVRAYQNFAITDDAVIFFFNQDGLLPHEDGPLDVSVPRAELASLLA
jgi:Protein of unknown function (DUF3298)